MTARTDWVEGASGPLEPIAYHDLQARPGFKLALRVTAGRSYLYVGHLWHSGWSILDVTDPGSPELVAFVPGPPNTWTLQVTLRSDLLATSLEPVPADWGGDPGAAFEEGVLLWDIADPIEPKLLSHFRTGYRGCHRSAVDAKGLLHLAARVSDHEGMILILVDLTDPTQPNELGRFSMPGQETGAVDALGEPVFGLHGPSIREGDTAFLPYGNYGLVIVDLADARKPCLVSQLSVRPPLGPRIAAHSAVPLRERGLLVLNSEALAEDCREPVGYAALIDISTPANPRIVSLFPTPEPPPGSPYRSFCQKGGRFGPHNQHIAFDDPDLWQDEETCFLTYFNAGLRVFDMREPRLVREVAYLIPRCPSGRIGPLPRTMAVQVEDVLVDARGIVYFTEKNSGLYIARWHGLS